MNTIPIIKNVDCQLVKTEDVEVNPIGEFKLCPFMEYILYMFRITNEVETEEIK